MIQIKKSPTADTRTCDWSQVSREQLLESSRLHIMDVTKALDFFMDRLAAAGVAHDHDKITRIDHFHADFQTGFKETGWYENHVKVNRHHLLENFPEDVNLIDVLEMIADCVVAGKARSGEVYPVYIPERLLTLAVKNTTELLKAQIEVTE